MQSKSKMYKLITLYKLTSYSVNHFMQIKCSYRMSVTHFCTSVQKPYIHQGFGEGLHRSFAVPTGNPSVLIGNKICLKQAENQ